MFKKFITIVLVLASVGAFGQRRGFDYGGIASAEAEVGLGGGFGLSAEEELRFDKGFTQLDRWLNSVGVDYSCLHNRMNIGLTADYIRRDSDKGFYENRGRLGLHVTYTEEYQRFKFQLRSKVMSTFLDDRTDYHPVNPKLYWRNRLKVTYQPLNSRFRYGLSAELFLLTNDPRKGLLDNLRAVHPEDTFYVGLTLKAKY